RAANEIVGEVVSAVAAKFPWPTSMRWGSGRMHWVRPLHSIVCLLDGKVVAFAIAQVEAGRTTRGHRFHGDAPFEVAGAADYIKRLKAHKVILDAGERAALIAQEARALAKEHKFSLVEDEALLLENAGLTEWPLVMMGSFDEEFLSVPAECLMLSMKQHQKCFSLKHPRSGKLANRFLLVSNLTPRDGGAAIIAGNEKVIRARLADAKFFWEQDRKKPLDEMAGALAGITCHEKLSSQKERVERIAELAFQIAGSVDAVPEDARRAAQLCKADLVSGMVGEFPELQGLMGRYYAEAAGTKPEIARAIELHYRPKGPTDTVPRATHGDAVAIAVAPADKLDTLVGFWAIGEKPTGSGDPYQLRRAALGVIRIVLENDLRLPLLSLMVRHLGRTIGLSYNRNLRLQQEGSLSGGGITQIGAAIAHLEKRFLAGTKHEHHRRTQGLAKAFSEEVSQFPAVVETATDLLAFFADRLKVHLREKGARHDLIDAVFSLGDQDDLALIVKRVDALNAFLGTDDGAVLLTGVKRATNIIRDEEKKDRRSYAAAPDPSLLRAAQELTLYEAILKVKKDTVAAINVENFAGAMRALAELRAPVDAFFDGVTVNVTGGADAAALRANRLALLSEIRAA